MTTSLPTYERALELQPSNFIGIARNRFHGLDGGRMADASDTQERQMSDGPIAQLTHPRKSSKIMASPSRSGQNGVRIDYQPLTTIFFFDINEAGKSIAGRNERL
jgi:hypothetical protein